jgi:alpha-galactosidase
MEWDMDRRTFIARTSALAALTKCGHGSLSAGADEPRFAAGADAPAEIIVSGTQWLLRNGLIQKELVWTGKELVSQLKSPTAIGHSTGLPSDIFVLIGGSLWPTKELRFVSEKHSVTGELARLELKFATDSPLELTVRYVCRRGDPAIEQSCLLRNTGNAPIHGLQRLDSMSQAIPVAHGEDVIAHWVEGLHGHSTPALEPCRTYRVRSQRLGEWDAVDLDSGRWSSNEKLPSMVIRVAGISYFGGLCWSGEWTMTVARRGATLTLQTGIADFSYSLAPGEQLESPAAFYGATIGDADQAWNSIHQHCRSTLMPEVPQDFPWVTYNTWYNFRVNFDEQQLRAEVDQAAGLGIEVFYIDDGWFAGSDIQGRWGMGAGKWTENRQKFPSGIAAFADYVHGRGLKFGLWVEPERIDSRFVDQPGLIPRSWLATRESQPISIGFNGPTGPTPSFQVCFGVPQVREWAIATLSSVIREYHVDWLKWDHNMYEPCRDWRHGHQPGAGDWAHTNGVYEVMQALLIQFPELVIENCAAGGHRFDYGLMRFTRVTWTSDVTQPSHLVRYHVFGASHAYPAQYLTAWYIQSSQDPNPATAEPAQVDTLFRSRMLGAFGISDTLSAWPAALASSARRSIALYKRLRPFLRGRQAWLTLQPQLLAPALAPPAEWDAVQYWLPETDESVVYAFRSAALSSRVQLFPRYLTPARNYEVTDEDGRLKAQRLSGNAIARGGIAAVAPGMHTSAILYIRPV